MARKPARKKTAAEIPVFVKRAAEGVRKAKGAPPPEAVSPPAMVSVRGKLASKSEVATWYGKAINTVSAWMRKGLPVISEGAPGTATLFDSAVVDDWLVAQRSGPLDAPGPGEASGKVVEFINKDREQARLYRAQADKTELDVAERQDKLLDADAVRAAREHIYGNLRARLLSVPSKAAPLVASEKKPAMCNEIIQNLIYEALQELSDTELTPVADDSPSKPRRRSKDGGKRKRRAPRSKAADKT